MKKTKTLRKTAREVPIPYLPPTQKLYHLTPRHDGYEYVIVSAVNNDYAHETYIFPADAEGFVTGYGELEGSYRDGTDHEKALRNAGYNNIIPTPRTTEEETET